MIYFYKMSQNGNEKLICHNNTTFSHNIIIFSLKCSDFILITLVELLLDPTPPGHPSMIYVERKL